MTITLNREPPPVHRADAHLQPGAKGPSRLLWLVRRLGRMYWREVPYRMVSALRGAAQYCGMFTATKPPPESPTARWGAAWCHWPTDTSASVQIERAARELLSGKLEVFDRRVPLRDGVPDWNADPVTGQRIATTFGLFIDFRHVGAGIDIKHLWEINRHAWWIPAAQAYRLTHDPAYLEFLRKQLLSWLDACPYPLGANWSSPVEHGIRLINWSIVWGLIGGEASPLFERQEGLKLRARWLDCIYQHMRFASDNYSRYSSADNHLIGEAAGVYIASHVWDRWTQTRGLRRRAKEILEREARIQFSDDGVCAEQAFSYHKFSLQFLLASGLCARTNNDDFSASFWARLEAGVTFLAAMMDCRGQVPLVGDSDDGDVWCFAQGVAGFNGFASLVAIGAALFRRDDLLAKVRSVGHETDPQLPWLPIASVAARADDPQAHHRLPRHFRRGGYVVMGEALHSRDEFRVVFDCGALGSNRVAGHGHADALSVLVSWGGDPLLVDSGTYCYNAAPELRRYFRGTSAHNTLRVDGFDQSIYGASFLWLRDVNTTVVAADDAGRSFHAFHDGFMRLADPVKHHRRLTLAEGQGALVIEDWLECRQPHDVEMVWHAPAQSCLERAGASAWSLQSGRRRVALGIEGAPIAADIVVGQEHPPQGWVSIRFYQRSPAPALVVRARLAPHQVLRTSIRQEAGLPRISQVRP